MKLIEHLVKTIREAANHDPEVREAPHCILWPDGRRRWRTAIPKLQERMPELYVLGDYNPAARTGPAIWLRCVLANAGENVAPPADTTPVIYIPGHSTRRLRAVERLPRELKPLAGYQYRGVTWSMADGGDWTVADILEAKPGGLGLKTARDPESLDAMDRALDHLLEEDTRHIKRKRLEKEYYNMLLLGGDTDGALLRWLDRGGAFRSECGDAQWQGLVQVCKTELDIDPENDGAWAAAEKLAQGEGPWNRIRQRFMEAPGAYPGAAVLLEKIARPTGSGDVLSRHAIINEKINEKIKEKTSEKEKKASNAADGDTVEITAVTWKGLRCIVTARGNTTGKYLDIRRRPGNKNTSVAAAFATLDENGRASVLVEDDDLEGREAFILLTAEDGEPAALLKTIIGGEK